MVLVYYSIQLVYNSKKISTIHFGAEVFHFKGADPLILAKNVIFRGLTLKSLAIHARKISKTVLESLKPAQQDSGFNFSYLYIFKSLAAFCHLKIAKDL